MNNNNIITNPKEFKIGNLYQYKSSVNLFYLKSLDSSGDYTAMQENDIFMVLNVSDNNSTDISYSSYDIKIILNDKILILKYKSSIRFSQYIQFSSLTE